MSIATTLYEAQLTIAGHPITWREIVGNAFGFASAVGGMRRRVWAWPVGIVGNVLLFTVFVAATTDAHAQVPLFGQAGRQVFFISVVGAGWPAPRWYFWCDAWIFVGSMLATYAMARGWTDFWLAWIAVDLVGVPLLWHSQYYPTAILFVVYGGLVLWGFVVWLRASRVEPHSEAERVSA
jgi:nicotinamide mononucleotide transporter